MNTHFSTSLSACRDVCADGSPKYREHYAGHSALHVHVRSDWDPVVQGKKKTSYYCSLTRQGRGDLRNAQN